MGSSPLTRAKRRQAIDQFDASGLIPAHAGKTRSPNRPRRRGGAHPRSRGENRGFVGGDQGRAGSSPLTRGKPRLRRPRSRSNGLIPAHAGKTSVRHV